MAALFSRKSVGPWAIALLAASCSSEPPPSTSFQIPPGSEDGGDSSSATGGKSSGGTGGNSSGTGGKAGSSTGGAASGVGGAATGGSSAKGGSTSEGGAPNSDAGEGGAEPTGGKSANTGGSAGKSSTGGKSGTGGASTGGMGSGGESGSPDPGAGGEGGSSEPPLGEFFGDSRCSDEFDLCEDFETGGLDTDTWSTMGSAPTMDETRSARGARSAHFSTTGNGLMLIRTTSIFPAEDNRYYGRLFVYYGVLPEGPQWAHWSVVGAQGADEFEVRVGGQFDGDINRHGVGTDHGPTGDWTNLDEDSDEAVPLGRWICVEWLHDGAADETKLWIDEVEKPSLQTTAEDHGGSDDPYTMPDFESVWVGFWQYAAAVTPTEFDVWIDEVALDSERIGCTR